MVLISVSRLFYESKLLGIEYISYPTFLGGDPWKLERFRVENQRRRVGNLFDGPWGATPTKAPQNTLFPSESDVERQPERLRIVSFHQALEPRAS